MMTFAIAARDLVRGPCDPGIGNVDDINDAWIASLGALPSRISMTRGGAVDVLATSSHHGRRDPLVPE